jgi:hypothetical protein
LDLDLVSADELATAVIQVIDQHIHGAESKRCHDFSPADLYPRWFNLRRSTG